MIKNPKKGKAIALRKQGVSYKTIEKKLGISRSTLSGWFAKHPWSTDIRMHLEKGHREWSRRHMHRIGKARADEWRERRKQAREYAARAFPHFKNDPLFIAGLMLYWGEGDSKVQEGSLRMANTHPVMLKIFFHFLKQYCNIDERKIRMHLILYPDLNDVQCKRYWSKQTGIPLQNFIKSSIIIGRHPTKRLAYGIGNIYISSCEMKEMVIEWIRLAREDLVHSYTMRV